MTLLRRLAALLSDLRLAILLLLLIASASAIGTILPQGEDPALYLERFNADPWLGVINGERMLQLQLDHVYSSGWFLGLLGWLGVALMLCSWRRQWPALQSALRWIDYREPRQLSKMALAETVSSPDPKKGITNLATSLRARAGALGADEEASKWMHLANGMHAGAVDTMHAFRGDVCSVPPAELCARLHTLLQQSARAVHLAPAEAAPAEA